MHIKSLTLYTNQLASEKYFYSQILGCSFLSSSATHFSTQIGSTELIFEKTTQLHRYHYCFLIPKNKLQEAVKWMKQRHQLIEIEEGRWIENFETWNADSIYFYDGSGNIAELIVRYDLDNESEEAFSLASFLNVNEIGMPTRDVEKLNLQLEKLGSPLWRGDRKRFGVNGTQDGLFLLPNYQIKNSWFPTSLAIQPSPFKAIIEIGNQQFDFMYKNEILKTAIIS